MSVPPSPQDFVRALRPALEQAAAIAASLEGRVPNEPKTGEASAVKAALTLADVAAQEALLVPLLARFRAAELEAEEATQSVSLFTGEARALRIVIDPIDGTLNFFLGRRGPYAVLAGLAVAGRLEAALVALPRERVRFEAVRGAGARWSDARGAWAPARPSRTGERVIVSDSVPDGVADRLRAAGFDVGMGCGGAVAVAPLLPGVRGGVRIARGGAISVRGRIGLLVAREAGARVEGADGRPFPEALDDPSDTLVVASDAETAAALRSALRG
jgi:fructose-1,6-bisphosphatase/inositol monophosphatase family enzyme